MRVRFAHGLEVAGGQQVEDEPIVALAEDLGADATWLLCDHHSSQIILAALLDPRYVGALSRAAGTTEYGLGFLNHSDGWNRMGFGLRELVLVRIEDLLKDDSGQYKGRRAAQLGHVDDTEFPGAECSDQHVKHLTAAVVQHLDDLGHVAAGGDSLRVTLLVEMQ